MKILLVSLLLTVLILPARSANQETADIIFVNANIYTANDGQPRAEAIAVKGERIIFVGSTAGASAYRGQNTRSIDLGGSTVVPGLTDSHYHLIGVGERE